MLDDLTALVRNVESWFTWVIAAFRPNRRETLTQPFYQKGYGVGLEAGRALGRDEAEPEPLVYRFDAGEAPPIDDTVDPGLYGPDRFPVSGPDARMRAAVATFVAQGDLNAPTDEQWAMILVDHPATCIAAGAGSGKSTTLVLRVVFMLIYLQIAEGDVTIISFTRDSCIELRHALQRVLGLWRPKGVSEDWLKLRVRTYHSLLYGLAKPVLPGRQFFELLPANASEGQDQALEDSDLENPMATSSTLNTRQAEVLLAAYRHAYFADSAFRDDLLEILRSQLTAPVGTALDHAMKRGHIWFMSQRDTMLTEAVSQTWIAHGWPFPGVSATATPMAKIWGQYVFQANGYDDDLSLPIVLGWAPGLTDAQKAVVITDTADKAGPQSFDQALRDKLRVLKNYSAQEYILIRSQGDLDRYLAHRVLLKARNDTDRGKIPPPVFPVKLAGEIAASPIHEAFYAQGSFVESLGKTVPELVAAFDRPKVIDTTVRFSRALVRYWVHLTKILAERELQTFNQAFLLLTRNAPTMAFRSRQLAAVRHLLVDEFQDVSPLMANWLKAMQGRLVLDDQNQPVSIMAIGDDWQSIYGWRGSAPQLFIRFGEFFPIHHILAAQAPLILSTNYRSVSAVVDDAKRLINKVQIKVDKPTQAYSSMRPGDHGVVLGEYAKDKPRITPQETATLLHPFVDQQYAEACALPGAKKDHVIVMTRRRKVRDALAAKFPAKKFPGLRFCTYHQAKGLEADVAILIEDCSASDPHPFRNLVYRASKMYGAYRYDQATVDEAWRLAYVGVTRGRRRVFWQVPSIDGSMTAKTFATH